jgi:hypothetical protein
MEQNQFESLRLFLAVLVLAVDFVILSIGLLHPGKGGYVVDGLAVVIFILLWMVGRATD